MARPKWSGQIDMDDAGLKRRLMSWVGTLRGEYEVTVEPRRALMSGAQRRYFFACVAEPFSDFLREQDYEAAGKDVAYRVLKDKFLKRLLVNPETGEVIGDYTPSLSDLTVEEMGDFIDRSRAWLLDFFSIVTQDPDPAWREHKEPLRRGKPVAAES